MGVFARSGLGQSMVAQICELVGAEPAGRLTFGKFVGAMHLINWSLAGRPLPLALPPDLLNYISSLGAASAASPADLASQGSSRSASRSRGGSSSRSPSRGRDRDVPSARDIRKYARLFRREDPNRHGQLPIGTMRALAGRSGLGGFQLSQIFGLAGISGRDSAGFPEFVAVMHLIRCARSPQRPPLPASLPSDLAECMSSLRQAPLVADLASRGSSRSASRSRSPTPRGVARDVPSERDCRKYARLFQRMADGAATLSADGVGSLLHTSGAGAEESGRILEAATGGRGQLSFPDFVAVMHLVRCARTGSPIPQSLPPALQDFLGGLRASPEELATQGLSRSASRSRSASPAGGPGGGFGDGGFGNSGHSGGGRNGGGFGDGFGVTSDAACGGASGGGDQCHVSWAGGDMGVAPDPALGRGALSAGHAVPPPRSHSDVWREAAAHASPSFSRVGFLHDSQAFAGDERAGHPSYLLRVSEILADRPRPQAGRPQDTMHTSTNPFSPPAAAASRAPRRLPEPAQASASFPVLRRVQPAFAHPGQAPLVPPKHFLGPLSLLAVPAPGHGSGHVAAESAQLRSRLQHLAGPSVWEQVSWRPVAYVGWGGGWVSGPLSADMPHLVRGEVF